MARDSWWVLQSGTLQRLNAVAFADAKRGIAVGAGGTILTTTERVRTVDPIFLVLGGSLFVR
jgi:photosystem II stability/assembly factor-like uncharacterized protein